MRRKDYKGLILAFISYSTLLAFVAILTSDIFQGTQVAAYSTYNNNNNNNNYNNQTTYHSSKQRHRQQKQHHNSRQHRHNVKQQKGQRYHQHQQLPQRDEAKAPNHCMANLPHGCSCAHTETVLNINCSHVRLTSVPKQWIDIGAAVVGTLNLEWNRIQDINDGDFFGVKIERILLGNNSLSNLKFLSFWGLEYSLEILDLSFNRFRRVPSEALRLLRSLKFLSLTGNQITHLADFDFGYMRKLELLMLDKNPIAEIGKHALVGTQLSLLVLDDIRLKNKLDDLPTEDLKYLKGLSLQHNKIKEIPRKWFRNLRSLQELYLGHNQITKLKGSDVFEGVGETLRTLRLNHNDLGSIPGDALLGLQALESLDLSHNKIKRLGRRSFNSSSRLATLNLSHNKLKRMSKRSLVGLDRLRTLDLRHNKLITLDDRMFYWETLTERKVYLGHNNWLCNCILRWLRDEIVAGSPLGGLFADRVICERPNFLNGTPIEYVPAERLTCDHEYYYYHDEPEDGGEGGGLGKGTGGRGDMDVETGDYEGEDGEEYGEETGEEYTDDVSDEYEESYDDYDDEEETKYKT